MVAPGSLTECLDGLVQTMRPRVLAYARRIAGDDLAEDVTQEVFLRLVLYARGRAMDLSLGFVLAVARNAARTMLQQRRRKAMTPVAPVGGEVGESGPAPRNPEASAAGAGARGRLEPWMYSQLAMLPERQREAFVLTEVFGLSEEQAARAMEMSRSAVGARRRAALMKLRQAATEPRVVVREIGTISARGPRCA